jgi:hypothetical protein
LTVLNLYINGEPYRSRKAKWVYGNPWAFKDPKVVKQGAGEKRESPFWDWENGLPSLGPSGDNSGVGSRQDLAEQRMSRRRAKKVTSAWDLNQAAAVSSGDSSAKSVAGVGKLSPLPPRKGIIKTRGTRLVAEGELSDEESARPRTVVRRMLSRGGIDQP